MAQHEPDRHGPDRPGDCLSENQRTIDRGTRTLSGICGVHVAPPERLAGCRMHSARQPATSAIATLQNPQRRARLPLCSEAWLAGSPPRIRNGPGQKNHYPDQTEDAEHTHSFAALLAYVGRPPWQSCNKKKADVAQESNGSSLGVGNLVSTIHAFSHGAVRVPPNPLHISRQAIMSAISPRARRRARQSSLL